jgi:hypothetical protein
MYQSNINTSQHDWDKKNLVTVSNRTGHYDEVQCKNCGMKGKRYGFEYVKVASTYKFENVTLCPNAKPVIISQKVKVTHCRASGPQFSNLTPNSIHEVVEPPHPYKNDHTGVWVMGIGEPVKLLTVEFVSV